MASKVRWYPVVTDSSFANAPIGDTVARESKELIGRSMQVSLMELTNDMKKQHINVKFRIQGVKDKIAVAQPVAMFILPSAIKRQVRRRRTRLDDSFICMTADKHLVRLKPIVMTRANTNNSINQAMRKTQRYLLAKIIEKITYETLIKDAVSGKLPSYMKKQLESIYPLRSWGLRYVGLHAKAEGEEAPVIHSDDYSAEDVVKKLFATKRERKRRTKNTDDDAQESTTAVGTSQADELDAQSEEASEGDDEADDADDDEDTASE
ncbi:hypothetical protein AUJ68_04290 [Candidatus Woesearchaeota archaeon CG1_02_57_44]|nr:MAG: hypothetical protein AUJ68_04290 [Candidatus Woesearchaeota archaeon CG1_02_57_44]